MIKRNFDEKPFHMTTDNLLAAAQAHARVFSKVESLSAGIKEARAAFNAENVKLANAQIDFNAFRVSVEAVRMAQKSVEDAESWLKTMLHRHDLALQELESEKANLEISRAALDQERMS